MVVIKTKKVKQWLLIIREFKIEKREDKVKVWAGDSIIIRFNVLGLWKLQVPRPTNNDLDLCVNRTVHLLFLYFI